MWTDVATTPLGTRLLVNMHPKHTLDLYLADLITLQDALEVFETWFGFDKVIKLHCAGGKSIKQVVTKTKTLNQVLEAALPQDLLADMTEMCRVASETYVSRKGYVLWTDVCKRSNREVSVHIRDRYKAYYPQTFASSGTFLSLFESVKLCNQEFQASGAETLFKIKFIVNAVTIQGVDVMLPQLMSWTGSEVVVQKGSSCAFVDSRGRATYFGKNALEFKPFMESWNRNAFHACDIIGKACSSCILCGRELTDPNSVKVHMGPICSARYSTALTFTPGPITGVSLVIPPSPTTPVTLPSGLVLSIPQRVIDASPFLQGLLECQDAESVDMTALLGVSQEALKLLDTILGDPEWVPESVQCLEMVLPVADTLGLDSASKRLEKFYLQVCSSLDQDIKDLCKTNAEILKNSGPITPFKTNKRQRGVEAHYDFIMAIGNNDIPTMEALYKEHGDICCKDTSTKTDSRDFEGLLLSALEKCEVETLDAAVRLGVKNVPTTMIWNRPGHLEVYTKYNLITHTEVATVMKSLLPQGTAEDVARVYALLKDIFKQPIQDKSTKQWSWFDALKNPSSGPLLWILENNVLPKTEKTLFKALGLNKYPWFVTEVLPVFGIPAASTHLQEANWVALEHLLEIPAYMAHVDSDFFAYQVERGNVELDMLPRIARIVELFPGPLEPRHCCTTFEIMEIIAAKFPLFPECVDETGSITYFKLTTGDIDVAVMKAMRNPERHMDDILRHYQYKKTTDRHSFAVYTGAMKLAALMKPRWNTTKIPGCWYNASFLRSKEYKDILYALHDDPVQFID